MLDALDKNPGANQWSLLLDEARSALSTLRVEDLDELAARAECMLSATLDHDSIRQRLPRLVERELLDVSRRHRLLADLLVATKGNLEVVHRLRGYDRAGAGRANSRWVR